MGTLSLENFPEEVHQKARSRAALEGISLRELVIQAITKYLASPITLNVQEVIVKKKEPEKNEKKGEEESDE